MSEDKNTFNLTLDIEAGDQQREFLDGLNATLRARMSSYSSSAGFDAMGNFSTRLAGPFAVQDTEMELAWTLIKDGNGTLRKIQVEPTSNAVHGWDSEVNQLIHTVHSTVYSKHRQKYFRRNMFFYIGPQLTGEYWLRGYRFAPILPEDSGPHMINVERPVTIDQNVHAMDNRHADSVALETAKRHAARLSLLLNMGLYPHQSQQRWVVRENPDEPGLLSERLQLGYFIDDSKAISEMPGKGEICQLGKFRGAAQQNSLTAGQYLSLPDQTRKILKAVDCAAPHVADAFDRGARLYQVGLVCGSQFRSVELAYRVAAIDALSQAERTSVGFSDFVRQYAPPYPDLETLLEYLYKTVRSAHFHGGSFPAGEFDRQPFFDPLVDADSVESQHLHSVCADLTREVIVNWATNLISDWS